MLVDNLKNKQPVLQSMFNVALSSSQQLQKKGSLMSELSLAYIFHHQQLLVDQNLQLPKSRKVSK